MCVCIVLQAQAQDKKDIKLSLNSDGSHYIQFTFLNQTWLRYNQNNDGTTIEGEQQNDIFDIGLRRTRFQMLGQISPKIFFYAQLGMNNFNAQFNANNGNRKLAFFMHDALCEYKVSNDNALKLGGGLTIANGLSRFSQPSIGTILTLDVPVFAQTTVDQTDEFSRKLSIYARGQIHHIDYRFVLSDPFPISSSGTTPSLGSNASFSPLKHRKQVQGYVIWQFFDQEGHTTPYMSGTYLGTKKVWNIAVGFVHQSKAMWRAGELRDTVYENMTHFAIESFLDMPLNKERGSAISAYVGFFDLNYGKNYLRYNGIMNPANGLSSSFTSPVTGAGSVFGNAYPMFGTGKTMYAQLGVLLPANQGSSVRWLPYASTTFAKYDRLDGLNTIVTNLGINMLLNGHKSKISLDWMNRPTYAQNGSNFSEVGRKNSVTMQYQIFF